MVHSTTPGAFRPAPPRDIYNANIQIRSQIHRRRKHFSQFYIFIFLGRRHQRFVAQLFYETSCQRFRIGFYFVDCNKSRI